MVTLLSILAQYLVDPVLRRNPVLLGFRVGNNEEFVEDDGLHKEGPGVMKDSSIFFLLPLL